MMDNDDVPFRPSRSSKFTPQQRWALLLEYDQCLERGSRVAFCRRIGVSSYTMNSWVQQRAAGLITEPDPARSRGDRRGVLTYEERQELERLRRQNERLKVELEQSIAAADILGKAAAFLEGLAKNADQNQTQPEPPPVPGRPAWLADSDTSSLPSIPPRPSKGLG